MKKTAFVFACLLAATAALADGHWVGTWGTAPQLVENNNNPPSPGLGNNSLRQIVQVSIGGDKVRLKLTNEFSKGATEIKAVELALAKTAGSSSDIDEASTVSLTFDGKASVTMPAGGKAVSDPVSLHLDGRQNVAITIHYGAASSTSVSGHPGSRTTSYLKSGNTTDFSGAAKTDHWYNILALEVEAPEEAGAVAILGNSITDGRGSTTNQQNRWADVLSRRLLANEPTSQVGVLNMGIGGNCVLGGGLGPAAVNRYQRDLFGQEGVKWIILFEAVNDLGSAGNGVQTARMQRDFLFENDWLHLNAKGYETMGGCIDLSLFTMTGPLAADDEEVDYGEVLLWKEAEDLRTTTVGTGFGLESDAAASGGKYLKTVQNITNAAPADSANMLVLRFNVATANTYYIYARVNCPTWDDDSYWFGFDGPMSEFANGLQTGGSWDWKLIYSGYMQVGSHRLTVAGREDGACVDKFCVTADPEPPTGMGGITTSITVPGYRSRSVGAVRYYTLSGTPLATRSRDLCIQVQRADDGTLISRKVIARP